MAFLPYMQRPVIASEQYVVTGAASVNTQGGVMMGNWACYKHSTHMDERSTPCPYCEIDRLREENALEYRERINTIVENETLREEQEQIYLSGIEAVKECTCVHGFRFDESGTGLCNIPCADCIDGTIVRELTKDEAIAAAKNIIKSMSFSNEDGETLWVKEV